MDQTASLFRFKAKRWCDVTQWQTHDVGIDYLRFTADSHTEEYDFLMSMGMAEVESERYSGHKMTGFNFKGYTGTMCGKVAVARRDDGCMFQASSSHADGLVQAMRRFDGRLRCSRIDTQVTGQTDEDIDDAIRRTRDELEEKARTQAKGGQITLGYHRSAVGGAMFAIGSRSSDRFGRFYNKSAEQRGQVAAGLGRFEVEFKGQQSRLVWDNIARSGLHTNIAADLTAAFFTKKGVPMDWVDHRPGKCLPSSYAPTTVEKQLRWLERNVAKTIRELCLGGHEAEVKAILGLDQLWL